MATVINFLPSWVFFLIIFSIGILAGEAGAYLKPKSERNQTKEKEGPGSSLIGSLLGLLAFMLAFTFSITASRFSERKNLVAQQAIELGTCYLRTGLIPEKQSTATRKLLGDYTELLIASATSPDIQKNITKLEGYHKLIWDQAISLQHENMDPQLRAMYIQSVNQVVDIFEKRKTVVVVFRIPGALWFALILLYVLAMFVVGAGYNARKDHRNTRLYIITASFSIIVLLIAEMDSLTKATSFRVSQQPLKDVQDLIKEDASQAQSEKIFELPTSDTLHADR
jgi:hypothetical protein